LRGLTSLFAFFIAYLTYNHVLHRLFAFTLSNVALVSLWVIAGLHVAASLGIEDAHYTAAMVFISLNDQAHAKIELRQYVKANPKDRGVNGLLSGMEHGNQHLHIHDGRPPQGVVARP
jgi:hypothetical protein